MMKKILSLVLVLLVLLGGLIPATAEEVKPPKYVFMFIGDGMGSPQITATEYFLGTLENPDAELPTRAALSFTGFENVGIMTTYDASSFCPDSASTATSMASGEKTLSGVINYDVTLETPFKLITEYAKEAGKRVGVLTSVSADHATPAAYYAKATSRKQYHEIAVQAATQNTLDYLGGGGLLQPDGDDGNALDLATQNGFTVANSNDSIRALTTSDNRVMAFVPDPAGEAAMQYEIDRLSLEKSGTDSLSLAEMTQSAIQTLDNENGFFLMVEGGKIDWSCHANDATTSIYETIALSDAVETAKQFAAAHPEETLIIVTGDHETGGMTIGFATTAYDTHFGYLAAQTMSYEAFDRQIKELRQNKADFATALSVVETAFGLTQTAEKALTLTADELASLQAAYELSMVEPDARVTGDKEAFLYGGYEPLSMAACHILNNKAGIAYTSYAHTGIQIPVYATGAGAEAFAGSYDNTNIFTKTMNAMGIAR